MNKQLIRDLAITGGIYDCLTDPYDKLKNGDPYSSVLPDLERFAEKIINECTQVLFQESERLYQLSSEEENMRDANDFEICAEKCIDNIAALETHFHINR